MNVAPWIVARPPVTLLNTFTPAALRMPKFSPMLRAADRFTSATVIFSDTWLSPGTRSRLMIRGPPVAARPLRPAPLLFVPPMLIVDELPPPRYPRRPGVPTADAPTLPPAPGSSAGMAAIPLGTLAARIRRIWVTSLFVLHSPRTSRFSPIMVSVTLASGKAALIWPWMASYTRASRTGAWGSGKTRTR